MNSIGTVESFDAIDDTLKPKKQFVMWEGKVIEKPGKDPRTTKVPLQANSKLHLASSTNASTWSSFEQTKAALIESQDKLFKRTEREGCPGLFGIGFVLIEANDLVGMDLDSVLNSETGELHDWARRIVEAMNTYTEWSPSKTGLRLFAKGNIPVAGRKCGNHETGAVEMYRSGRFLTLTGDLYHG